MRWHVSSLRINFIPTEEKLHACVDGLTRMETYKPHLHGVLLGS